MEDYMSQLNEQQRAAVDYIDGPQLVIAGAGSGKTRVLTYKIVHLLAHGYEPWRIMALTFTNKAAREMRQRIECLAGTDTAKQLWMGTFHSIFGRILRINAEKIGYTRNYTIYDTTDSKSLVKSIIKDMGLDDKTYKVSTVMNTISMAKNALISPEDYALDRDLTEHDKNAHRPQMADIYRAYRNRCRVADAMDFDDLLFNTNILLRDNPELLRHYQEFFRYVLVDEYQDTNFAQHLIIAQLTRQSGRLCVVGDDAQSIYSFRGANIRNILNLRNGYPTLQVFKLEQNYRSTQRIINAANTLIAKNKQQIPKTVFSRNDAGDRVDVVQAYSEYEEANLVASRLSRRKTVSGDSYEEFAILYRTNAQSRALEESLRRRNIPYRIYGGLAFYQRKEIKDAIAYFRMAVNPADDEALKRIINTPARGIGQTTLQKLISGAIASGTSIWQVLCNPSAYNVDINRGTLSKLNSFRTLIERFRDKHLAGENADALARLIISDTRLLSSLLSDATPESISKQENLQELLNAVRQFVGDHLEQGAVDTVTMADFLAEVSLATDQDEKDSTVGERVTLMTIHAAKGLEFGNVFIVGVEEDLLPSSMSLDSIEEIEEERRLLYVAITRAKKYCMISFAKSRFYQGTAKTCQPSRFLRDIDGRYIRLLTGTDIAGTPTPQEEYRKSYHSQPSDGVSRPNTDTQPTQTYPSPATASSGSGSSHGSDELTTGMRIVHDRFGEGTIIKIDTGHTDHRITVDFNDGDQKVLLLKYAKFSILGQ